MANYGNAILFETRLPIAWYVLIHYETHHRHR
jgi:hypothetical protein